MFLQIYGCYKCKLASFSGLKVNSEWRLALKNFSRLDLRQWYRKQFTLLPIQWINWYFIMESQQQNDHHQWNIHMDIKIWNMLLLLYLVLGYFVLELVSLFGMDYLVYMHRMHLISMKYFGDGSRGIIWFWACDK